MINKKLDCGVYAITNKINKKVYIGSSINIDRRRKEHIKQLDRNTHHSSYLQNSWNKYGKDSFVFSILLVCSKDNVLFYEQFFIDHCNAHSSKGGYNSYPIAGSCAGAKRTEEEKARLRSYALGRTPWNKGIPRTEEQKKYHSEIMKGRPVWNTGKTLNDDQRLKLMGRNLGRIPWNKGVPVPESQKKIQSEKMKGKPSPNKGKECPNKGGTITEEQKVKISIANKGKKREQIIKVRKSVMLVTEWADKKGIPFSYLPEGEHKRYKK